MIARILKAVRLGLRKCGGTYFLMLFLSLCYGTIGCSNEVDMKVSIDGKNPPTFKLSGSGELDILLVVEVASENQQVMSTQRQPDKDVVLWEIWPDKSTETEIKKLPHIKYGTVPSGFIQKIPAGGQPSPLIEGRVYAAGGPARNANGGSIWFSIRNGESVEVSKPGGR